MLRSGAEGTDISLDLLDCSSSREGLYLCVSPLEIKRAENMAEFIFDVLQTAKDGSRSLLDWHLELMR